MSSHADDVDFAAAFDGPRISTTPDGHHFDEHGQEYIVVDELGELSYARADDDTVEMEMFISALTLASTFTRSLPKDLFSWSAQDVQVARSIASVLVSWASTAERHQRAQLPARPLT